MGFLRWSRKGALSILVGSLVGIIFLQSSLQADSRQEEIDYYRNMGIQPLVSGAQEGDFSLGTYLIPHDIIVEKGKSMNVFPGTTILFTQNAMLVVNGSLVCTGTKEAPVLFRRLDNKKYYRPIDPRVETRWDGIYLPDGARCEMRNTIVSDSKYGIVISGKDVSMIFDSVQFVNNKFQNVKIGERVMKIAEKTPIVFMYPEQKGVFVEPAVVKTATESIQQNRKQPHTTSYPRLRVGMGITGIVGLGAFISGLVINDKYYTRHANEPENEKYSKLANAGTVAAVGGGILLGVGAAGFTWTFFF